MFSIAASKFIKETCKSLSHLALTNFMHDITFSNGEISMLVRDEKLFQFYYNNKIPTLCTDRTGRTLDEGIYLNKTLEEKHKSCAILMPLLVKAGKKVGQNYAKNSVHIVIREADCQHLYSLFFDLEEIDFLHWVVNNGRFLQDFIEQNTISTKDIVLEAKAIENRIVLPTSNFLSPKIKLKDSTLNEPQLSLFHKISYMTIHLSKQQSKSLLLLSEGKSAKEIAFKMNLSSRTVEHYLERIRKQLGCSSNKQLIASYRDQLPQ